jgi:hypothetical protein
MRSVQAGLIVTVNTIVEGNPKKKMADLLCMGRKTGIF